MTHVLPAERATIASNVTEILSTSAPSRSVVAKHVSTCKIALASEC